MKTLFFRFIMLVVLIIFSASLLIAQKSDFETKTSSLLNNISVYKYGDDDYKLFEFDQLIWNYANSNEKFDKLEEKIIEVLQNNITWDAKNYLCKKLGIIGTGLSVDLLGSMVKNEETSDIARFALEKIKDHNVDKKFISLLDVENKQVKIGIINSLANRECKLAVDEIASIVKNNDIDVACAAASALGNIGGDRSVKVLFDLLSSKNINCYNVLLDSYLSCGDEYYENGKLEEASKIYLSVYEDKNATSERFAALKGLILSSPETRDEIILNTLQSNDRKLINVAISQIEHLNSDDQFNNIEERFRDQTEDNKVLILNSISRFKLNYFLNMVINTCESEPTSVSTAAIRSLASIGSKNEVELLSSLSTSNEREIKNTAQNTLYKLVGTKVNEKITSLIPNEDDAINIELIKAVGERRIFDAFNKVILTAKDKNRRIRYESYLSIGEIGAPEQLPKVLELFLAVKDVKELNVLENSLAKIVLREEDSNQRGKVFLNTIAKTSDTNQEMSLIRILGATGDEDAYEKIDEYLNDEDETVKKVSIQSLYNWPNLDPLNRLIDIVKSSDNETHQILALRGYINLLKAHGSENSKDIIENYSVALKHASEDNEIKMVMSGLAQIRTIESANLAANYLTNANVQPEAEIAILEILNRIGRQKPVDSKNIIKRIIESPSSKDVEIKAKEILNNI